MKCSTTLLEKTSASPQRNMKRSPANRMHNSNDKSNYFSVIERQASIVDELSFLCHQLINELHQYKNVEAEEQRLEEIEQ